MKGRWMGHESASENGTCRKGLWMGGEKDRSAWSMGRDLENLYQSPVRQHLG